MINNIADLKNRTLVESNTLKSFILAQSDSSRSPDREDILIHDYQIANSVTLNTILSNYVVNLKYAWKLYDTSYGESAESYFQIIEKQIEELDANELNDQTRLILEVCDGQGTFKSRKLEYDITQITPPDNTIKFINLDTVWYGIQRNPYDTLKLAEQPMNDPLVNQNPFGQDVNLFSKNLTYIKVNAHSTTYSSFNDYVVRNRTYINCIAENLFYRNVFEDTEMTETNMEKSFGKIVPRCRYLVCLDNQFCGLQPVYSTKSDGSKEYTGFNMYDIGALIPNIDQDDYNGSQFHFVTFGFYAISDVVTMFVVFNQQVNGKTKYHYVYFNEDSYDSTYGFTNIKSVVVDQLIVKPDDVFTKVEELRGLDNVNIVMTDYGFWDIEPNMTSNITYSYRQKDGKTYVKTGVAAFNSRTTKLVKPTIALATSDKVDEYDKVWELAKKSGSSWVVDKTNGTNYKCKYVGNALPNTNIESPNHENYPKYLKEIIGTGGKTHQFVGGTVNFGVYDAVKYTGADGKEAWEPVHILPQMTL